MNRILLSFILLLGTLLPAGSVKKFDVNPINLAVVLVEKADSANIDGFFKYYGYTLLGTENDYHLMKHDNGNEISYSFKSNGIKQKSPTIIVKISGHQKDIDERLRELKFQKIGNVYERMVNRYKHQTTQCNIGPNNTLIFKRTN